MVYWKRCFVIKNKSVVGSGLTESGLKIGFSNKLSKNFLSVKDLGKCQTISTFYFWKARYLVLVINKVAKYQITVFGNS